MATEARFTQESSEVRELGHARPDRLQRKLRTMQSFMIAMTVFWGIVIAYSTYSTMRGYLLLNLGALAIGLTFASQTFTVLYAIPSIDQVRRRYRFLLNVYVWILICGSAHFLSYLGSAFYQTHLIGLLKEDSDLETVEQRKSVDEVIEKLRFNTIEYRDFLENLTDYYDHKYQDALSGIDLSGIEGKGSRSELFRNVKSEIQSHLTSANDAYLAEGVATASRDLAILTRDQLATTIRGLGTTIRRQESKISSLATASDSLRKIEKARPRFDFAESVTKEQINASKETIKNYINSFPFVRVQVPYDILTEASDRLQTVAQILAFWNLPSLNEDQRLRIYGGIALAVIIEVATVLFNGFVFIQRKNHRALTYRTVRTDVLNSAVGISRSMLLCRLPVGLKLTDLPISYPVYLLRAARDAIGRNLQMGQRILCTEISARPIEFEKESRRRSLVLHNWGLGYEGIYCRLNGEWISTVLEGDISNLREMPHVFSGWVDYDQWNVLFTEMIRKVLMHLERTGELQVFDGGHWVDFMDFDDWVSVVVQNTGDHGRHVPQVDGEDRVVSAQELIERIKSGEEL